MDPSAHDVPNKPRGTDQQKNSLFHDSIFMLNWNKKSVIEEIDG